METTNHKLPTANSKTLAGVTTAKGTGAISSIRVTGPSAGAIIKKIFRPTSVGQADFEIGNILTGNILDCSRVIDHVVIGCEGKNNFEINCHGNPIIVEIIIKLLKSHGAQPVDTGQILEQQLSEHDVSNSIAAEAKLAQLSAVTLEGVKIIANQAPFGLVKIARQWLQSIERLKLQDIAQQCEQILADSKTANLIINGCKVVIAGPANSGKSTLLNYLAGRQKAIVTNTAGTTRDWVTGRCRTDRLLMELIDTAGLEENLPGANSIDGQSQRKAVELLTDCDLVLFVLDGSKKIRNEELKTKRYLLRGKKVLVVLNKLDLGIISNESQLNFDFEGCVSISAKSGEQIGRLLKGIQEVLGVADFDLDAPVCFSKRQCDLLELLSQSKSKSHAKTVITDLLTTHTALF
jgi:tRNA modification GTPase